MPQPKKASRAPGSPPVARKQKPATIEGVKARLAKPMPRSFKQIALDAKAEDTQRRQQLYGRHAADVDLLSRRGFVVTRHRDGFMVGNKECTAADLRAKADRERRLMQPVVDVPARRGRRAGVPA